MTRYAIIVAGGKGVRMGGDVPKQFRLLCGRPVLMHTIEAFRAAYADIRLIMVLPAAQHAYWESLCIEHRFDIPLATADGGETRSHSVKNGLSLIPMDAEGLVAVHDGVRPLVDVGTIHCCFEQAERSGAAVPVTPVVETLRCILPEGGSQTVDRSCYCLVQTPQVFRIDLLREAYRQPYQSTFTDDASVVEALGATVSLVEGNRENLKLTTPADLLLAESVLRSRTQ